MLSIFLTSEFEDDILNLIDYQGECPRGDLQGMVTVLVNKIMVSGYRIISEMETSKHAEDGTAVCGTLDLCPHPWSRHSDLGCYRINADEERRKNNSRRSL